VNPLDEPPNNAKAPISPGAQKVKRYSTQTALALELPFTIVGAVLLGGVIGYFLDYRLHTQVIFTLILGAAGFAAGLREVLRRLS
jgi:F0F1-type ATP synthase assembly protein I